MTEIIYNKIKFAILTPFLKLKKFFKSWLLKSKIKAIGAKRVSLDSIDLDSQMFLFSTFLCANSVREEILQVSMKQSFEQLKNSELELQIFDASSDNQAGQNESFFKRYSNLKIAYNREKNKPAPTIANAFSGVRKPYFCMLFDDQPIIGLTENFLKSSAAFLDDYKGLVDVILIENLTRQTINHQAKEIIFKAEDLDFQSRGIKPVATVKYGDYTFAIIKNFHYGFFFNTLIARTEDYANRLAWYRSNVSAEDSNLIELAAAKYFGPTYYYIAIPLEVYMVNLDFSHTSQSVRGVEGQEKDLFLAFINNYQPRIIKSHQ